MNHNQTQMICRYRTDTFGSSQCYDPAKVMEYETMELQNSDIPLYLSNTILQNNPISQKLRDIVKWLDDEIEFLPFDIDNTELSLQFWKQVVIEIERETQTPLNFVLWLADIDAVTDADFYGKYITSEADIDTYQIGSIVLAELGYDGTLYGYSEKPQPIVK